MWNSKDEINSDNEQMSNAVQLQAEVCLGAFTSLEQMERQEEALNALRISASQRAYKERMVEALATFGPQGWKSRNL